MIVLLLELHSDSLCRFKHLRIDIRALLHDWSDSPTAAVVVVKDWRVASNDAGRQCPSAMVDLTVHAWPGYRCAACKLFVVADACRMLACCTYVHRCVHAMLHADDVKELT